MVKRNIYDSVFPSIYASLLLGFSPICFQKVDRKFSVNKCGSVINLIYLVLFISMVYLGTLGFNPFTKGNAYNFNTLATILILVVTVVLAFGTCVCLIQGYFQKHDLRNFFNSVTSLDDRFLRMGYYLNHKTDFYLYLAINFLGPVLAAGNFSMQLWNISRALEKIDPIPPVLLFCHMYAFALSHHGESLFVIANVILRKRFMVVNSILRELNDRCSTRRRYNKEHRKVGLICDLIKNWKSEERILEFCMQCHDKLCDLCAIVNRIFGFLIIVGSLVQFNTIVFAFCYCYYNIHIRPISSLGWFIWTSFCIYELTRKTLAAHLNTCEAERTLHWIHKLMIRSEVDMEEKLKIFSLQIKHRTKPMTALGLFPIAGSFAFTIIGATTTYITIIYQFQVNKLNC